MATRKLPPTEEFDKALTEGAAAFGVAPSEEARARLLDYFGLVGRWNARLHLVSPCAPAEFATRHVLESLVALAHMPEGGSFVDVGSGAGLPAIPCLVARPDLSATLYESSQKKAVFLRETLHALGLNGRASVVAERFEKTPAPAADRLTCRAIERFTEILPHLLKWSEQVPTLLLFGGENLRERLDSLAVEFETVRVPESERRFLFVVRRRVR
ncbi:MAG TPA: RsmG family class I SAM-dependent methyltransferase [Pyrinomonadaceae bacterium]|nr:RsmG family class I SAM-dependent methyltransferase [Pyrinomonadaceae bacterium]